ncbi:MAG: hypothetical protein EOO51_00555 [Flavobacterium sp.]|nr:MAG: hypothetical protein EOO51_00555 [Flavobacterium sp.]
MDSSKVAVKKDFLFVIELKNEAYYQNPAELKDFLQILPPSIRIYTIIHAGMNMLKVYCITNNYDDYSRVAELTHSKTQLVDNQSVAGGPTEVN